MFFAICQSEKRDLNPQPIPRLRVELTPSLDKHDATRYNGIMSESINIPLFTDKSYGISVDPTGWRTHPLWCALCNYLDLLDSRYAKIARIMVDNILAIMQADFMCDARESKLQRDTFNYRQRILRKYAPMAHRPESFIV
jgi:hypothetical protein